MSSVNTLLSQRLKKKDKSSKMVAMAKETANGKRSTFAGIFSISDLTEKEKSYLEAILNEFTTGEENISEDLNSLISITSEVKAINNQAAILHGERIKRAQTLLTKYRDGAFTAWLIAAYGNRQTPYNFLQYYEFYKAMPKTLHPQIETMPRQAIYTLASRDGPIEKKKKIIEKYQGQTKAELLNLIRLAFPIADDDKRGKNLGEAAIKGLRKLFVSLKNRKPKISRNEKKTIYQLLDDLKHLVRYSKIE